MEQAYSLAELAKKPIKKRHRIRLRRPRQFPDFGPKSLKSMRWLKIGWQNEKDFRQDAYEEMQRYLAARNCEVRLRPHSIMDPNGLPRTLYVHIEKSVRAYNDIKRKVCRLGVGMSTWKVPGDPFECIVVEEDDEEDELQKGA